MKIKGASQQSLPPRIESEPYEPPEISTEAFRIALALLNAGPYQRLPEGICPLSWGSLRDWADLTMPCLSPGDFEDLHFLSAVYLGTYRAAEDPKTLSPLVDQDDVAKHKAIARGFRAVIQDAGKKS